MRTTANVSLGIKRHLVLQIMSGNMDNLRMSISVKNIVWLFSEPPY